MKFSTFFIIFFFYFYPSNLSAEIFYVDMSKIINETKVGNYINNEFESLKKKNNEEILNNRNELKKREESLIAQKKIIEESEFNNKLNLFKQDVEYFNKMTKKKNKDLQNQLLNNKTNFLKLIEPILLEYVSENNITYLLQKKYIIVGHNDLNITTDIIELVDKKINISNFNDSISK